MALKYAPICTRCGKHRTLHQSGLCSHCRRRPAPRVPCKVCGNTMTNHESKLCTKCRRRSVSADLLHDAVERTKRTLLVLEMREQNCSFSEIGKCIGMSKSSAFELYRTALSLPAWSVPAEN